MTSSRRPLRRLAVLTALLATVTAGVPASTSGAAPADGVTGADLPQVVRAAGIFPYLRGGERLMLQSRTLEHPGRSCTTQSRGYPAESVRFASYVTRDGGSPYFQGREDPTFVVYEFADRADAQAGFAAYADYVARCRGRHGDDVGTRTLSTFAVPDLGRRELGVRTVTVDEGDRREEVEVYVLQGDRIERSWIQLDRGSASVTRAVRMARMLRVTAR